MTSDDRHQPMEAARHRSELSVQQLWLRYVALGGSSDAFDIDGFLQGLVPLDSFQQDVLAQAVNEGLEELYQSLRVPLSKLRRDGAVNNPLEAVIKRLLAARPIAPNPDLAVPRDNDPPPARPPPSPREPL
jgi:hypothetical protein